MARTGQRAVEHRPDLAGSAGDDNLHGGSPSVRRRAPPVRWDEPMPVLAQVDARGSWVRDRPGAG
ncbi:hypothetical protein GCM10010329_73760 [Streptomyces spiroverticillatus]|uniref:Uncharacterized protein n=1 Tax=Streptomyces finlayi TaxID=67296 RepID=A0A918X5V5_9ACTN|nr:hypothetical protein GCM10010329_73760 [Streptomyces spiroverticillatus]GHD14564.1 hypothetical protein GCM10010334_73920 [Streptomyces finlayi]